MPYNDLTLIEKRDFIGKLIIAAETDYFSECLEVVNLAQLNGLYEKISPASESHPDIKDLDNPIARSTSELY